MFAFAHKVCSLSTTLKQQSYADFAFCCQYHVKVHRQISVYVAPVLTFCCWTMSPQQEGATQILLHAIGRTANVFHLLRLILLLVEFSWLRPHSFKVLLHPWLQCAALPIMQKQYFKCRQRANSSMFTWFTLQVMCSYIFMPVSYLMGIQWSDCFKVRWEL